jgi:hypothetical protein
MRCPHTIRSAFDDTNHECIRKRPRASICARHNSPFDITPCQRGSERSADESRTALRMKRCDFISFSAAPRPALAAIGLIAEYRLIGCSFRQTPFYSKASRQRFPRIGHPKKRLSVQRGHPIRQHSTLVCVLLERRRQACDFELAFKFDAHPVCVAPHHTDRRPATIEGREGQEPPRSRIAGPPGGSAQVTK